MGNARNSCNIDELHVGVGRGFKVDHARGGGDRGFKCLHVGHVDMFDLDAELPDAVMQQGKGAAIQGAAYDQFIPRAQ